MIGGGLHMFPEIQLKDIKHFEIIMGAIFLRLPSPNYVPLVK